MKLISLTMCTLIQMSAALASNYPSDYCRQQVYTIADGPTLLARVKSGCLDQIVIGYKNSGTLVSSETNDLKAIVSGSCNSSSVVKVTEIKLGREWHGTGYVNTPESIEFYPNECYSDKTTKIGVAFTDGKGNWDSRYGQNYNVVLQDFFSRGEPTVSGSVDGVVGVESWNIIIEKMRQ